MSVLPGLIGMKLFPAYPWTSPYPYIKALQSFSVSHGEKETNLVRVVINLLITQCPAASEKILMFDKYNEGSAKSVNKSYFLPKWNYAFKNTHSKHELRGLRAFRYGGIVETDDETYSHDEADATMGAMCLQILSMHALSGSDTVSYHHGKCKM